MVKVKICGNQTSNDLKITAKADAVGFIVATPGSARNIEPAQAARLAKETPPFTNTAIVTTETKPGVLREIAAKIKPDYLQLHSFFTLDRIKEIARSIPSTTGLISLLSVKGKPEGLKKRALELANSPVEAVLLDSKVGNQTGGTGRVHNWEHSRKIRDALHPFPVILAGGLNPGNVGKAIMKVRPYGVDVATGVEDECAKSKQKIEQFLEEVKNSES